MCSLVILSLFKDFFCKDYGPGKAQTCKYGRELSFKNGWWHLACSLHRVSGQGGRMEFPIPNMVRHELLLYGTGGFPSFWWGK